nr:immunoglobulin heavy chain junction region [Macaca mulatta]MOX37852.1 immunoglobulin heavy chain junction region [Macaca mulatta]MOX38312.1 immunoglobulin heavy chain junction region [Macaca mulatta]MOX38408.1 immunoglobulin heavy chain junction region [Macaca mulatta]MOX39203.1 immunoglobulin heavy chain junction region [Macaca mulatta]
CIKTVHTWAHGLDSW